MTPSLFESIDLRRSQPGAAAKLDDAGAAAQVDRWLNGLPKPLVIIQPDCDHQADNVRAASLWWCEIYAALLDATEGSLLVAPIDEAPVLAHARMRYPLDEWGPLSPAQAWALLKAAHLFIAFDHGPFDCVDAANIPAIGVWRRYNPVERRLPGRAAVNLVSGTKRSFWVRRRHDWHLVEYAGREPAADVLARLACRLLAGPRYATRADSLAHDVQLQQFIDWCRQATPLTPYADRHQTFDRLLREASARFSSPVFVETGCIRLAEDWSAGYSTYVFSAYLAARGAGCLHSVDIDDGHLRFAAGSVEPFGAAVTFHRSDSVEWLRQFPDPIDVLYLDSLDADAAGHEEHALAEIEAAHPKLHDRSLVLIDDTPWRGGWIGKGAKALPWLTERGWRIVLAGHQVLLARQVR